MGFLVPRRAIIDAELVACDSEGKPDFHALMRRSDELCLWCFDLPSVNGVDLRDRPLIERRRPLEALVAEADDHTLRQETTMHSVPRTFNPTRRCLNPSVPLIAVVFPEAALAATDAAKARNDFHPHHILCHFVAELALDA